MVRKPHPGETKRLRSYVLHVSLTRSTIASRTGADSESHAAITGAKSSGREAGFQHTIAHFLRTEVYCFCSEVSGLCPSNSLVAASGPGSYRNHFQIRQRFHNDLSYEVTSPLNGYSCLPLDGPNPLQRTVLLPASRTRRPSLWIKKNKGNILTMTLTAYKKGYFNATAKRQ